MELSLWRKLNMSTQIGKLTYNIDDAWYVGIPDEETAEELSEWSKVNNYPTFINCEVGLYIWDNDEETFYKDESSNYKKNKMNKCELAEIAIKLKNNVDEAEQFSNYINDLIRHCDKDFLLYLIKCMVDSVEFNLTTNGHFKENIFDDTTELKDLIRFIREEL